MNSDWLREDEIHETLMAAENPSAKTVCRVLEQARNLKGLDGKQAAVLMHAGPEFDGELFRTARWLKERIYGRRLVLFAPLYISNHCSNECLYCGFRAGNRDLPRRRLTEGELEDEVRVLLAQGHKRLLLVSGEAGGMHGLDAILAALRTIYSVREGQATIRRVNVYIAPLDEDGFRRLKPAGIGTYQLFQETYHRTSYARMHVAGRKRDFNWRLQVMDRAMQAGIDDVGIGVLFGHYEWKFEVLALLAHARHLEKTWGAGPHTISVPRLEPADHSGVAAAPPFPVTDRDFCRLIAIIRLAVPYTGIILSTRESAEMRRQAFALGVSQISAGSRTRPGGYREGEENAGQFNLGDHRSLEEVIRDVSRLGYVPSFCTGCYRLGRTGADFMDLARPGEIRAHCDPNAVSSFSEYLADYADGETRAAGEKAMEDLLAHMEPEAAARAREMKRRVEAGERDVYC